MKNILILSVLLLSFFSCKEEEIQPISQEPAPISPTTNSPIVGNWSLIKRYGGFYPTTYYDEGDIQWNFSATGILTTTISEELPTPPNVPFTVSNVHPYSLISSDSIVFSDFFEYRFFIQNDSLILSQGDVAADGKIFTFKLYL